MADEIQQELDNSQLSGKVDVDFNAEYVRLHKNHQIGLRTQESYILKC